MVLLTQVVRQSGDENVGFVELLARLREGKCTDADYLLLQQRVLLTENPDWNDRDWFDAPIIVNNNAVKDLIKEAAALAFARRTGRPLHWYYCTDMHEGKPVLATVGSALHWTRERRLIV